MIGARIARAAAILIAVLGAIDPAFTLSRSIKPIVSVIAADPTGDSAGLVDRVARVLSSDYTVVRGPLAGASATVSVGDRVPDVEVPDDRPAFAVLPIPAAPRVTIAAVDVVTRASIDARVPVSASIRAVGARGRQIDVTLRAGGIIVDRQTHDVSADDERFASALGFLPTDTGAVSLQVAARVLPAAGAAATADATGAVPHARVDAVVDVERRTWKVLFFDRRPSWASTFVRRALEEDTRFDVASRIETSRAVSTATSGAPPNLSDARALVSYDAVVVGAPEALTDGDVATLAAFARDRAGAVVLLMEQRAAGPYDRLVGVSAWREATRPSPAVALGATGLGLGWIEVSELVWPAPLPPGATPLAFVEPLVTGGRSSPSPSPNAQTVVWAAPLGQGRLVVSGALDAWRFRASSNSTFDRFWRGVIGAAADASPGPIEVRLDTPVIAPGGDVRVHVSLRDAVPNVPVTVSAEITSGVISGNSGNNSRGYFRLWPDGEPGSFSGVVRVPAAGQYRVAVSSGALKASAPLVVAPTAVTPMDDDRPLIDAWASAHRGVVVDERALGDVSAALDRAIHRDRTPQKTRPMRSPWWIVPFALALGFEWSVRRRDGRA